jgi:hypothetical protein
MSRGQITQWRYVNDMNNDGTIIGCSPDVFGQGFGFFIVDVVDPVVAAFLRSNPNIQRAVNCSAGPNQALWVTFTATGNRATNVRR